MKKERLKLKRFPLLIAILVFIPLFTLGLLFNTTTTEEPREPDFINDEVIETTLPVINDSVKPINPYVDSNVKVGKTYYDYQAEEKAQLNSIIMHDNTYIQNSGIDYIDDKEFDVVAILNGTVVTVKEDELVGKTIEIKHEDETISTYQSLSEVNIKKGDVVTQGQVIGKSGTNELDKDLGNHLHFEIYQKGKSINPDNYLNKEINIEKEN